MSLKCYGSFSGTRIISQRLYAYARDVKYDKEYTERYVNAY